MFGLLDIVRLGVVAPERLAAHTADVRFDAGALVWRVRSRSPAFQRAVSLVVEGSTEALGILWVVTALSSATPGAWVELLLPVWLGIQALILGVVVTWERRGASVRVVRVTPEGLSAGATRVPSDSVTDIDVRSEGWGPWRQAEVVVHRADGPPFRWAADGDDDASLQTTVRQMRRALSTEPPMMLTAGAH